MLILHKSIFGKTYRFICDGSAAELLQESVRLYADSDDDRTDVCISIVSQRGALKPRSQNPATHFSYKLGMAMKLGHHLVSWFKPENGPLECIIEYKRLQPLLRILHKYSSMECPTEVELFEQSLHELVLVPSVYFFEDLAPIHSSAVKLGKKSILFSGTGGVGKSSALLALRDAPSIEFIADDISIIGSDGFIHANMAWPKIYGYNCKGTSFSTTLLKGRGPLDKLHFSIRNLIDPSKVRRKIEPDSFYRKAQNSATKCSSLIFLFRENVSAFSTSELSVESAVSMSISVMLSEYTFFHNHLYWEEYNAEGCCTRPLISMSNIVTNWRKTLTAAFQDIQLQKISVPVNATHQAYLDQVHQWIK